MSGTLLAFNGTNLGVIMNKLVLNRSRGVKGFVEDIEKLTVENDNFRKVLYTGKHLQLVLMTLQPGEEIGSEVHEGHDQFFRIEEGNGRVMIDDNSYDIEDDDAIIEIGRAHV